MCHRRFHGILSKEWGLFKEMFTEHGISQILLLTQLISEIKNIEITPNGLFYTGIKLCGSHGGRMFDHLEKVAVRLVNVFA